MQNVEILMEMSNTYFTYGGRNSLLPVPRTSVLIMVVTTAITNKPLKCMLVQTQKKITSLKSDMGVLPSVHGSLPRGDSGTQAFCMMCSSVFNTRLPKLPHSLLWSAEGKKHGTLPVGGVPVLGWIPSARIPLAKTQSHDTPRWSTV